MDVTVEKDVPAFEGFPHHHLGRAVFRALLHAGGNPLPVQVKPTERAPVVTDSDSIRVEHGDNLKYKVISEVLGHLVLGD